MSMCGDQASRTLISSASAVRLSSASDPSRVRARIAVSEMVEALVSWTTCQASRRSSSHRA